MTKVLRNKHKILINCKRTRRYMREMGIHGFCPGPNLSKRLHKKYLYPYLLRSLNIDHPNQVWSVDITYCRMKHGFMYLVAVIDWYSRYIVGFGLSNTLEKTFVMGTINKAIKTHGAPEIMNSDQGSQFTSQEYVDLLKENSIKISIDGKGRALDNQRRERFFRSYVLAGRQPVMSDRRTKGYWATQMSRVSGCASDERASLALDIPQR